MEQAIACTPAPSSPAPSWRDLVWPKEHGSWSLALEPVALGLLVAPSLGGAGLAIAATAGFFTRRPLRTAISDARPERRAAARRATDFLAGVAALGIIGTVLAAGVNWWPWVIPSAIAGAVFIAFDLQKAGREQYAEIAGAIAFAWLPAIFATLAGWTPLAAMAVGAVMLARAVPTVISVRSVLRAQKSGQRHYLLAMVTAVVATALVVELSTRGLAPWTASVAIGLLAARSFALLVYPRPAWRASVLGMIEAGLGVAFVVVIAVAWRV